MSRHIQSLIIIFCLVVFYIQPSNAETKVTGEELKELITGKTLEGRWMLWESNYRMYMDPSGEFKRIYGKGDELTSNLDGNWWINKKGKLCYEVNKTACRRVKKRDDGGYNLYNKRGELKQTIDKITDGNPYNLQ